LILKQLVGARAKVISDRLPVPKDTIVQIVDTSSSVVQVITLELSDKFSDRTSTKFAAGLEDLTLLAPLQESYMWPVKLPFIYPSNNPLAKFSTIEIDFKSNFTKVVVKFSAKFLSDYGVSSNMYVTPVMSTGDLHVSGIEFSLAPLSRYSAQLSAAQDSDKWVIKNRDFALGLIECIYKLNLETMVTGVPVRSLYRDMFSSEKFSVVTGASVYTNSTNPRGLVISCYPSANTGSRIKNLMNSLNLNTE
jgi:hypothetical protein